MYLLGCNDSPQFRWITIFGRDSVHGFFSGFRFGFYYFYFHFRISGTNKQSSMADPHTKVQEQIKSSAKAANAPKITNAPARFRSFVWKYFGFPQELADKKTKQITICKLCFSEISLPRVQHLTWQPILNESTILSTNQATSWVISTIIILIKLIWMMAYHKWERSINTISNNY